MTQNNTQPTPFSRPMSSGRKFAIPAAAKKAFRPAQAGEKPTEQKNISVKTGANINRCYRPRQPFRQNLQTAPKLKIIPLGGLEEIGRNMTLFEYNNDIVIVDMGLQFPDENMPGIDYVIPDISYLKGREKDIRGVIITHGHMDHIGAIPHLMPKLGNPPIYTAPLTAAIIKKRQDDYKDDPSLNIRIINKTDRLQLGIFSVEFFHVNHNIPDGFGIVLHTPVGNIFHTGDFKFDFSPIADKPADIGRIARLASQGALLLMSDSTDAMVPGHSLSENKIQDSMDEIFKKEGGRIIAATFSSLISRIQELITLAERHGRKVAFDGYSMKTNVEIARRLKYINTKRDTIIKIEQVKNYDDKNILIICTGAQGEGRAVLMRIINNEHRSIKIKPNDTIIFSSSVIPGNERTIQSLKDSIYRRGAKVIHNKMMDVHAGGHAQVEDLKMMMSLVKPKFFLPIHGNYYMLKLHGEIAQSVGIDKKNILIPENGRIIELDRNSIKATNKKAPTDYIMVDGLGVGDVGHIVLRDRQMMSKDGMFTIIVIINSKTGQVTQEPDIISRGFIYMKESRALLNETRLRVKKIIAAKTKEKPINWTYVRNNLRDLIGDFLYQKTQRRPMVLPVIIEV